MHLIIAIYCNAQCIDALKIVSIYQYHYLAYYDMTMRRCIIPTLVSVYSNSNHTVGGSVNDIMVLLDYCR